MDTPRRPPEVPDPPDPVRLVPRPRQPGRGRAGRPARRPGAVTLFGSGVLAPLLLLGAAAPASAGTGAVPPVAPVVASSVVPASGVPTSGEVVTEDGACATVGSSRAGRAWLPRARVLVPGAQVLAARATTPGARADAVAGLVEVQRTARRSPAASGPVRLELLVLDGPDDRPRTTACTVALGSTALGGTAPGSSAPDSTAGTAAGTATGTAAGTSAHGVRRLVRAD